MRRNIAAVSIAFAALLLLHGAGAKPAHRVDLAPGYSVEIPDGFASCDAATNKRLGNAPHLIVLREMCASAAAKNSTAVLINLDPAMPVTVSARSLRNFPLSADTFDEAGPDAVEAVRTELCSYILKAYRLDTCLLRKASVAGSPTFIGDASGTNPQGRPVGIRVYILPGTPDAFAMAFFTRTPVPAKSLAAIEAVAASVRIALAPTLAPAAPVTLALQGVTLSVPKEWSACDAANGALLTGAMPDETAEFCPDARGLRVFSARPPYYQFVEVSSIALPQKTDPDQVARMLAPDQLAKDRDTDCRGVTAPLVQDGAAIDRCDDEAGTVGGHPAKIVTFVAVLSQPGHPGPSHIEGRTIEIPLSDRMIEVKVSSTSVLAPKFTAATDDIVKSLVIP